MKFFIAFILGLVPAALAAATITYEFDIGNFNSGPLPLSNPGYENALTSLGIAGATTGKVRVTLNDQQTPYSIIDRTDQTPAGELVKDYRFDSYEITIGTFTVSLSAGEPSDRIRVWDEKAEGFDSVTIQNTASPPALLPDGTRVTGSAVRTFYSDHLAFDDAGLPDASAFIGPDRMDSPFGFYMGFYAGNDAPIPSQFNVLYGEILDAHILAPVPVPLSGLLLLSGLGALAIQRQTGAVRRKQA